MLLLAVVSCLYGQKSISQLSYSGANNPITIQDVQPMDTIKNIEFATRVDSLYKCLAKEPGVTWEIVFKDGVRKPDLQTGDILKVTSEDGSVRYYYLKLNPYIPSTDALLGSITWPDMPVSFKGEMAQSYGWHGDTIPSFDPLTMNYVLILPKAYQTIPALTFSTHDLNAMVKVGRAVSLEGSIAERTITFTVIAEDSITKNVYTVLLKKEQDTLDISQKSTVTSRFYKVSEGNSLNETIKGIKPGTPIADFYSNITKASELQMLKVISANSGSELAETDIISMGDTLIVLSADKMHATHYMLELTLEFPSNALLTSSVYTISVTGTKGTISGFPVNTILKTVLANISMPSGTTLTVVDKNDAYKPLIQLNYDTAYADVRATHDVYFEVISEDGVNKVLYQLLPDSRSSDAYVTSDLYSVDQVESIIYFLRPGTSVASLLRDMTPALGAIIEVMDKGGFIRSTGIIYKDDRLVISSEDRTNRKIYYFKTLDYKLGPYLAFIVSDEYSIDQISHVIYSAPVGTSKADFISKLFAVRGATIHVLDHNGNISSRETLSMGDYVMVTSENGIKKTIYIIDYLYDEVETVVGAYSIKIFPNPTEGRVEVWGLAKGNRIMIITPSGAVLYDRITESSSLNISLDTQPAGVYLFIVSKNNKAVSIHKVVKQ